jgi:hypothetical protein
LWFWTAGRTGPPTTFPASQRSSMPWQPPPHSRPA